MKWEKVTLGEISKNIQTGPFGSQLHQADYSEHGTPVVMPKDLINRRISDESIARVNSAHVDRLNRHKIDEGDILYSRRGDVGRCAFASSAEKGWLCGTGCLRVTVDKTKAVAKFIFYQLQRAEIISWVENHAVGSTMLNLNTSILSAIPVTIPDIQTQTRIASVLSTYDNLIENNQKQIKLLEEAAQRLYQEWFVKLRFPGHEKVKIVDGVPDGWHICTIDSFLHLYSGFAFKSATFTDDGKYGIVTIKNVKDGSFDNSSMSRITDIPSNMPIYCHINNGDILLSLTGNIGRVCLAYGEYNLLNQRVAKISSQYPGYVYCLFRHKSMFNDMQNLANGAAQQNLSPIRLGKTKRLFPSDEILSKFELVITPVLQEILTQFKQIESLKDARDRLLPKLMSGEIEV
jgi:type I restriction enzyme S subunit